jgi:hypothetical protein
MPVMMMMMIQMLSFIMVSKTRPPAIPPLLPLLPKMHLLLQYYYYYYYYYYKLIQTQKWKTSHLSQQIHSMWLPPPPPKSNPLLEKDSLQLAKYLLSNNNTEYTTGAYLFIINMLKSLLDTNNNTVISFTNNE